MQDLIQLFLEKKSYNFLWTSDHVSFKSLVCFHRKSLLFKGPLGNLFMNINLFPGMLLVPLISISKGTDQQHSMPEEPAG